MRVLIAASLAAAAADGGCFSLGSRVDARFRGGGVWYAGVVDAEASCLHNVTYDDGDVEVFLSADRLRAHVAPRFARADRVEVWDGGDFREGRVAQVWGTTVDVVFDDGALERGVFEDLVRAAAPAPAVALDGEDYTRTYEAYLARLEDRGFRVALTPRLKSLETNVGTPLRTRTTYADAFARAWVALRRRRGTLVKNGSLAEGVSYPPLHVVARRVLDDDALVLLRDYVRAMIADGAFPFGDTQTRLRYRAHNETAMRLLQFELLPFVEEVWGRRLKPTYTYLSSYLSGARLPKHTDGVDCAVSVSFVVDKPEGLRWPLYVAKEAHHTPYLGRAHADDDLPASAVYGLDADPGGALLFRGTDHVHFRRELRGEFFSAILLHYCPYEGCGA